MDAHAHTVIDLYKVLQVPRTAPHAQVEAALKVFADTMRQDLGNPLQMKSANSALKLIVPAVRQELLASPQAREHYDQRLVAFERKQEQQQGQDEWSDGEGLDEKLHKPFFFDIHKGYDIEPATQTLRDIANRLDSEWQRTRSWLQDRSRKIHPLALYLTHMAFRPHLAKRADEEILQKILHIDAPVDMNEMVERCITLLNPTIERPTLTFHAPQLDSTTRLLKAGPFLPDEEAHMEVTLEHRGTRGCVFGSLESGSNWLIFADRQQQMRFSLMPQGALELGPSRLIISLSFDTSALSHRAMHTTEIVLHVENAENPTEVHIPVDVEILALPPRVFFEPFTDITTLLPLAPARRGTAVACTLIPRNKGDEHLIPLVGRMHVNDPRASIAPALFYTDQPVTLTIDTGERAYGSTYIIEVALDYSPTPGARGPEKLYIQGSILPTAWGSLLRHRSVGDRIVAGMLAALGSGLLLGGLGAWLADHLLALWFLFFVVLGLMLLASRLAVHTLVAHRLLAGDSGARIGDSALQLRWGLPIALALCWFLICGLIPDLRISFLMGSVIGVVVGGIAGFIVDQTRSIAK